MHSHPYPTIVSGREKFIKNAISPLHCRQKASSKNLLCTCLKTQLLPHCSLLNLAEVSDNIPEARVVNQPIHAFGLWTVSAMNGSELATDSFKILIRNFSKKRSEIIGFDVEVQQEVVHHHWSKFESVPILGCLHEAVLSKCKHGVIASHSEDLRNLPSI